MAQIVTITNPLTGQPAQVDQLDHTAQEIDDAIARALPGGAIDVALQNNDPRNWGLGAYAKNTSDLDSITDTGWSVGTPLVDGDNTLGGSAINHIRLGETDNAVQIAYTNSAGSWYGGIVLIREKKSGIWSPWSWVNPPMILGGMDADGNQINEYRTTERYLGKPVYAKAVSGGAITADSKKAVSMSTVGESIVDACVVVKLSNGTVVRLPYTDSFGGTSGEVLSSVQSGIVYVSYTLHGINATESTVIAKYTKTTD